MNERMKPMNPVVKAKWLDALEGDQYVQGRGQLRYKNTFCCLGVLCDLYTKEHDDAEWKAEAEGSYRYAEEFYDGRTHENAILTQKVADWAGLMYVNGGNLTIDGSTHELPVFNDGRTGGREEDEVKQYSFKEIAAAIREQL